MRKAIPIDLTELSKLAGLHCTTEEVASWFGVTVRTIQRKLQQKKYREAWEHGMARGKISLRRMQWRKAEAGDSTMLIWLGKQWLKQSDRHGVEVTGDKGGPVQHENKYTKLTDKELEEAIVEEAKRITGGAASS